MQEMRVGEFTFCWELQGTDLLVVAVTNEIDDRWTAREVTIGPCDREKDLKPHALCTGMYGDRIERTIAEALWPQFARRRFV